MEDISLTYNFPYEQYKNFAFSYITGSYTSGSQVFTLESEQNTGLFPVNPPFKLVLFNVTDYPSIYDDPTVEIVNVTGRWASGFYVTRAQENTTGFNTINGKNYAFFQSISASDYNDKWEYLNNPDNTVYLFDDFDYGIATSTILGWTSNGTSLALGAGAMALKRIGFGFVGFSPASASGNATLARLNNQLLRTDTGPLIFKTAHTPFANEAESFPVQHRWGLGNVTTSGGDPTNGLYFQYHTSSGSHFVSVVDSVFNYIPLDLGFVALNLATPNYRDYKIVIENSGLARAYVNGAEISGSPITSNIPWGSGYEIGPFYQSFCFGTTRARLYIDYLECYQQLTGYRTQPLIMTDMVSYWPLYETGGTAYDSHGSNHLTGINNNPTGVVGILTSGRQFNGTNQNLFLDNANIGVSGSNVGLSVWGWVNFSNTGNFQNLVSVWDTNNQRQFGVFLSGGNLQFQASSAGTNVTGVTNATLIPLNQWMFFNGYYDNINNIIGIRVNDNYATEVANGGLNYFPSAPLSLGASYANNIAENHLSGVLNEIGIVTRALTTGEADFLYNNSGATPYPFSYYNETLE